MPGATTDTVPPIPECAVQTNENVPGVSKRHVELQGASVGGPGSAGSHELGPAPPKLALWSSFPMGLMNVTVPPAAIVAVVDDVPVTYQ